MKRHVSPRDRNSVPSYRETMALLILEGVLGILQHDTWDDAKAPADPGAWEVVLALPLSRRGMFDILPVGVQCNLMSMSMQQKDNGHPSSLFQSWE